MENQFDNRKASPFMERIDFNGFHVFPSEVESVRYIIERHPNLESDLPKNPIARTGIMVSLLLLNWKISRPVDKISKDDLVSAHGALTHFKARGLSLKWFEEKVNEVSQVKKMAAEMEEQLKELKLSTSNLEEHGALTHFKARGLSLKLFEEKVNEVSQLKKMSAEMEEQLKELKLSTSNLEE